MYLCLPPSYAINGSLTVEYEKKCVKALKKGFFFCQIFCVYVCYFMLLYAIIRHRRNAHESSYHKIKKCGIVLHSKVLCQIRRRSFIKKSSVKLGNWNNFFPNTVQQGMMCFCMGENNEVKLETEKYIKRKKKPKP